MEQNQGTSSLFQLNVDGASSYVLRSAASWAKILAILGFIMGAFFIIMGIMIQSQIATLTDGDVYDSRSTRLAGTMGLVFYIIFALVYMVSSIFALNFANKVSTAMKTNDGASLSSGFAALRNYMAFWAILMIISILFVLLFIVGLAGSTS